MLEEIKKEIEEQSYNENFCTKIIQLDDLFKILDNQPDYKSAFINAKERLEDFNDYDFVEELEQKYKLGGE